VYNSEGRGTEFFKIDENNPFLDDLLKQTSPGLNGTINAAGCNFMSIIAYPQLLTGNVFNSSQILGIFSDAVKPNGGVESNASVYSPEKLSDLAWKSLGKNDLHTAVGRSPWWDSVNGMVVGNRITVPYQPFHFTVGGNNNSILYNPAWTTGVRTPVEVMLYGY